MTGRRWPIGLHGAVSAHTAPAAPITVTDRRAAQFLIPLAIALGAAAAAYAPRFAVLALLVAATAAMLIAGRAAAVAARRVERATAMTQARERARFARLLHDRPLQVLETLTASDYIEDPTLRSHLADEAAWLRRFVEVNMDSCDVELIGSLRATALRFGRRGLRCRFEVRPPCSSMVLTSPVVEAFESATTEALNNVLKHAGVAEATIGVVRGTATISVLIVDAGRGFCGEDVSAGCVGVRHSVSGWMGGVGGTGIVSSVIGRGTEVCLTYPLSGQPSGATFE